eukprot:TRINITY_DN65187_c0_g1_i1.p1 TRINITY_DN65187_c0_g1~~TRINITY_DN65187_c0_g1_i1.p1  ORF type:complete len:563 (+),score=76.90 TRINITY_DN65187_c0_g1_i1:60-1691(+)
MASLWFAVLFALPSVQATGLCKFNLDGEVTSADFPASDKAFARLRLDTGTINGPLPVQPNDPSPPYDYDVDGYISNFKKLGVGWVRFQDLSMTQGGTSLTQIFSAWPRTDEELQSADVKQLAANSSNFNFTSLDLHVKAALAAGARIDFRLGDSHQIASLLQEGAPVPMGDKHLVFPKDWAFPTNIATEQGLTLWSAVALQVAERVWQLVGADKDKVAFDLLTETTEDTCFWPSTAARYAELYSSVMSQIKTQLGADVQCIGGNTLSPQKKGANGLDPWLVSFLKECAKMGYEQCPLDVVAFHIFSPNAAKLIPQNARWVVDQMNIYLKGFQTLPRIAITAWGFHGSGMFDYNAQPSGAAMMADALIAIENTPIDFMIYYKWAGINCKNLQSPCMVVNVPGTLKPMAIPFEYHFRMRTVGTDRIVADCGDAGALATRSADNKTISAMVAPANGAKGSGPLNLAIENMPCAGQGVTLSIDYLDASVAADGSAVRRTVTVRGKKGADNLFVTENTGEPYEVEAAHVAFVALLTFSCQNQTQAIMV